MVHSFARRSALQKLGSRAKRFEKNVFAVFFLLPLQFTHKNDIQSFDRKCFEQKQICPSTSYNKNNILPGETTLALTRIHLVK